MPDPAACSDAEWAEYVFLEDEPGRRGHANGGCTCRPTSGSSPERDTATDKILETDSHGRRRTSRRARAPGRDAWRRAPAPSGCRARRLRAADRPRAADRLHLRRAPLRGLRRRHDRERARRGGATRPLALVQVSPPARHPLMAGQDANTLVQVRRRAERARRPPRDRARHRGHAARTYRGSLEHDLDARHRRCSAASCRSASTTRRSTGRKGAWKHWEPLIRRIAGLGKREPGAPHHATTTRPTSSPTWSVVGGGPAGHERGARGGEAGAEVLLVEEVPASAARSRYARFGASRRRAARRRAAGSWPRSRASPNITVLHRRARAPACSPTTCLAGHPRQPPRTRSARKRRWSSRRARSSSRSVFRNNDLPGIMLGSARAAPDAALRREARHARRRRDRERRTATRWRSICSRPASRWRRSSISAHEPAAQPARRCGAGARRAHRARGHDRSPEAPASATSRRSRVAAHHRRGPAGDATAIDRVRLRRS